jgi:hypothetical protein
MYCRFANWQSNAELAIGWKEKQREQGKKLGLVSLAAREP